MVFYNIYSTILDDNIIWTKLLTYPRDAVHGNSIHLLATVQYYVITTLAVFIILVAAVCITAVVCTACILS